jgi:hypothetical protein
MEDKNRQSQQGIPTHTPGTRRGEDMVDQDGKEAGRYDTGKKGKTERPTGKSTPRDQTGINPTHRD